MLFRFVSFLGGIFWMALEESTSDDRKETPRFASHKPPTHENTGRAQRNPFHIAVKATTICREVLQHFDSKGNYTTYTSTAIWTMADVGKLAAESWWIGLLILWLQVGKCNCYHKLTCNAVIQTQLNTVVFY